MEVKTMAKKIIPNHVALEMFLKMRGIEKNKFQLPEDEKKPIIPMQYEREKLLFEEK